MEDDLGERLLKLAKEVGFDDEDLAELEFFLESESIEVVCVSIMARIDGQFDSGHISENQAESWLDRIPMPLERRNFFRQRHAMRRRDGTK